jgi:hypothetical protein
MIWTTGVRLPEGATVFFLLGNVQTRGLKLKSYAGQTDNFEIYGGPHVIFSNIRLSILFKIEHNIKNIPHFYDNNNNNNYYYY